MGSSRGEAHYIDAVEASLDDPGGIEKLACHLECLPEILRNLDCPLPEGGRMLLMIDPMGLVISQNAAAAKALGRLIGTSIAEAALTPQALPAFLDTLGRGKGPVPLAVAARAGHHLGRLLREQGHDVRLMSPEYVRPYVKAQKNDDRDAEAIAEAATRPTMRFVDLKSDEQLDMQSLHRARDRLVGERTTLINQLRAILLERGIVMAKGRRKLELRLDQLLAGEVAISRRIRLLVEDMRAQWRTLDERIGAFDAEFVAIAREDAAMKLLSTIPGVGPLNAIAFVASVGRAETFGRGRDLAAWLGLVPRQMTTGGKPRLLGISKRGNGYLRRMLIHGARAALPSLAKGRTLLGEWLRGLLARTHMNTAVVALAAKMARIIWAVLRSGRPFQVDGRHPVERIVGLGFLHAIGDQGCPLGGAKDTRTSHAGMKIVRFGADHEAIGELVAIADLPAPDSAAEGFIS
ncbi:transposase [Ancylobacter aquaticus]|uniref:Transposase n=1 Tax=Ancylobacter aquaticus TaxID=100 RepID=A0A4R1HGE7_ANCAQ|nr:transposase [Ancylobacter aquaticus]